MLIKKLLKKIHQDAAQIQIQTLKTEHFCVRGSTQTDLNGPFSCQQYVRRLEMSNKNFEQMTLTRITFHHILIRDK
jgi:predicted pyridoxine 5'-phosphate oxidase superfamily flavin-nucleotide-binding protein